jgi:hypothetical protein
LNTEDIGVVLAMIAWVGRDTMRATVADGVSIGRASG